MLSVKLATWGEDVKVGVFSPVINWCGGAEWVAVNIITALKEAGHQVVTLTDSPLDQQKFLHVFNRKVLADQQIIFPLRFFSPANYHNIYTDGIRSLLLKTKCDILVDTFSNSILPGMDIVYIHHPLLRKVRQELPYWRNKIYFLPYQSYLNGKRTEINEKLVFANSKFTAEAIKSEIGITSRVLYPSVSEEILGKNKETKLDKKRDNNVTTVARIANGKNLEVIPHIARMTRNDICFTIVGLLDDVNVYHSLLELIKELKVSNRVKILVNVNREYLKRILYDSKIYLHPKVNEHFGISIIEGMAAGCIPIVHDSGGPREFVPTNQRFNSISEAADIVEKTIDTWAPTHAEEISNSSEKFGENNFSEQFIDSLNSHFN